jgi:hypothetical protein
MIASFTYASSSLGLSPSGGGAQLLASYTSAICWRRTAGSDEACLCAGSPRRATWRSKLAIVIRAQEEVVGWRRADLDTPVEGLVDPRHAHLNVRLGHVPAKPPTPSPYAKARSDPRVAIASIGRYEFADRRRRHLKAAASRRSRSSSVDWGRVGPRRSRARSREEPR